MEQSPKTFIEELQSLDEPIKRNILIVATILIMIVVIYFWLAYFNGIVASVNQPAVADQTEQAAQPAVTTPSGPGFWDNVGNGTAMVYQSVLGGIEGLGSMFGASKQYNIQGK